MTPCYGKKVLGHRWLVVAAAQSVFLSDMAATDISF